MSNNSSSSIEDDVVSISLAGVSTIACIIALGVLLYYKMWRTFIYRLVLYLFISLIVFSLCLVTFFDTFDLLNDDNLTDDTNTIAVIFTNSSLAIAFLLVTYITVSIYLMALHNYQFTYKSDLRLLVISIFYLAIVVSVIGVWSAFPHFDKNGITILSMLALLFPIDIVFTALTLVPLCCRACGYNLCMKTAATIESHRKALREVLPFFILIVPSFFFIMLLIFDKYVITLLSAILYGIPGLVCAVSFALHLCFIRKNLKKLRGKKKAPRIIIHRTAVFTSEGISASCNTEHLPVSEDEEDSRLLLQKSDINLSQSYLFVS